MVTVTWPPDWVTDPFQSWVIVCPAVYDQVSRQLLSGSPWLVMVTLAPNPPGHDELTEYATEQPAAALAEPAMMPAADTATATAAAVLAARPANVRLRVMTLPRRYGRM